MQYRSVSLALMTCLVTLTGCATVEDYKPVTKNGQEYIGDMPVMAKGEVVDLRVTDKDGSVQSFASGAADVAGPGGGGMAAATAAGLGTVQAGLVGGISSGIFDLISRLSAPKIELMIKNDADGSVNPLPINSDSLYILTKYRCVDLGDRIRIVKKGRRGFDVYNEVPELIRLSDFQPECPELKANIAQNKGSDQNQEQM